MGSSQEPLLGETLLQTAKKLESADFEEVPVIDLAGLTSGDINDRLDVAREVRDACIRVGFFYIKGHGVPQEVIERVFEASKNFFSLPDEDKMEVYVTKNESFKGYEDIHYGAVDPQTKGGKLVRLIRSMAVVFLTVTGDTLLAQTTFLTAQTATRQERCVLADISQRSRLQRGLQFRLRAFRRWSDPSIRTMATVRRPQGPECLAPEFPRRVEAGRLDVLQRGSQSRQTHDESVCPRSRPPRRIF